MPNLRGVEFGADCGMLSIVKSRWTSPRVAAVVLLLAAAGVLTWWTVHSFPKAHSLPDRVTILSPLMGVATALVFALLPYLRPKPWPSANDLRMQADTLTVYVAEREREQNAQLLGRATHLIDLGFSVEPDTRTHTALPLEGSYRLREILEFYRDHNLRQLVIIGEPGAGKTVAAMQLMLRWLKNREPDSGDPLPVRVSLPGWHSQRTLEDALAERLEETYPYFGHRVIQDLVKKRFVVPVFDGLDELDRDPGELTRAAAFLDQLKSYWDFDLDASFILTCRAMHYERLKLADALPDVTVIRLSPVTADQAHDFLTAKIQRDRKCWSEVLGQLQTEPRGHLATALASPWRLNLAITSYNAGLWRDPSDLLSLTLAELDDYFLSRYVRSATQLSNEAGHGRHDPARVERWLSYLADHLARHGGSTLHGHELSETDITLHDLWPIAGYRAPRYVQAGMVFAILLALGLSAAPRSFGWVIPAAGVCALPGLKWCSSRRRC
jgi:hypothetical protein